MNEMTILGVEGSVIFSVDIGLSFLRNTNAEYFMRPYIVYFSHLRFSKPAAPLSSKLRTPIQCCSALNNRKFTARWASPIGRALVDSRSCESARFLIQKTD